MPRKASFISRKYAFLYLKYVNAHPYIIDMFQFVDLSCGWGWVGGCWGLCGGVYVFISRMYVCRQEKQRSRARGTRDSYSRAQQNFCLFTSVHATRARECGPFIHVA
jgi:hypothetical protein